MDLARPLEDASFCQSTIKHRLDIHQELIVHLLVIYQFGNDG